MTILRCFGLFVVSALLWGCAELPVPPLELESATRPQADVGTDGLFRLSGRIAVSHNGESFSGSLRWSHAAEEDEIFILSPLGQGVARIVSNSAGASLETSDGQSYRASDVESLTKEVLGWRLPARGLQYWVMGRSAPDSVAESELDDKLQLRGLRQNGWRVDYLGYRMVQGTLLPAKLEVALDERLRVRLVIDDWVLP
ncbi:MAG: lipoprotein insertase outer membrane protein LolB [Gammaproteobacteria bacterium]|nr:lipoprotein insertase outer membrane protein LolB [Gammaproteobacteria bacterium]MBU1978891.1 lipoprotein insertase outer membrane protein LolB [Gammaproteobacteria bacterium]